MQFEDLIYKAESPGLRTAAKYDFPIARDKTNNYDRLEAVMCALINGCNFGKLCLVPTSTKEPRKWLYNAIAITDSFLVSFNKKDIFKMVENQRLNVLK